MDGKGFSFLPAIIFRLQTSRFIYTSPKRLVDSAVIYFVTPPTFIWTEKRNYAVYITL
jgi:hypothetical protein